MSDFCYSFANVRRIVKKNRDQIKKKKTGWFSSEEYKVEYDEPALILTQRGAQEEDENQYLKYDITADAIKLFMEKNRKWFSEPEGGGDWVFDETVTEKSEPFLLEEMVGRATKENMRFVDYVSDDRSGDKICCFYLFLPYHILCYATSQHSTQTCAYLRYVFSVFLLSLYFNYRMMSSPPKQVALCMA